MTIKQRQHLLAYLGYYVGSVDGIWGTLSKTATVAFQKDFGGLTANGTVDEATEKALTHAVAYGIAKNETTKPATGSFWDEIEFFDRSEFKCTCNGRGCNGYPVEPEEKLIRVADRVRKHFGASTTVSSGVRCKLRNSELNGSVSNSRHLSGKAMDFSVAGRSATEVLNYVQKQSEIRYAYAIDKDYVHMDVL